MSRDSVQAALQAHFAHPEDPGTTRAFFDEVAKTSATDTDVAIHQALLTRPPRPSPRVMTSRALIAAPIGAPMNEPVPPFNWAGNMPLSGAHGASKVTSTGDIDTVIKAARALPDPTRRTALALGTTHSSSPVVQTTGTIIDTGVLEGTAMHGELRTIKPVDAATLLPGIKPTPYYWVGSGLKVIEVIQALNQVGRALPMLGAYTGQTYVGATCTGTHGSGVAQGALHTQIRAVDLCFVDATGKTVTKRIERTKGITDPAKVPAGFLIQNDEVFRAALVSVGMLGVVVGVIIETILPYNLQGDRISRTWTDIRAILADVDANHYPRYFANTYTAGVLMNPYPWPLKPVGPRQGVVTRGWIPQQPPTNPEAPSVAGGSDLLFHIAKFLGNHTALTPWVLNLALDTMHETTDIYGPWWQMLASSGDLPQGYSVEYSLPLSNYLPALDAILDAMYDLAWNNTQMLAGTLSIRFVRGDDAYLSMAQGRDSVFMEFLTLAGIDAAPAVFARMEQVALAHGARPHWGQWFCLPSMPKIMPLYPQASLFRQHGLTQFDPGGVFENEFSKVLRAAIGP